MDEDIDFQMHLHERFGRVKPKPNRSLAYYMATKNKNIGLAYGKMRVQDGRLLLCVHVQFLGEIVKAARP